MSAAMEHHQDTKLVRGRETSKFGAPGKPPGTFISPTGCTSVPLASQSTPMPVDLKAQFAREVAAAVATPLEAMAARRVDSIGESARQSMMAFQQEHTARVDSMQSQLMSFTESSCRLQRENAALRGTLDNVLRQMQMMTYYQQMFACQGASKQAQGGYTVAPAPTRARGTTGPHSGVLGQKIRQPPGLPPTFEEEEVLDEPCYEADDGDDATDATDLVFADVMKLLVDPEAMLEDASPSTPPYARSGSPVTDREESAAPLTPQFVTPLFQDSLASTPSTAASTPTSEQTPQTARPELFNITLRRVEGEPLGMEVHQDDNEGLVVESIKGGTVVGAWNEQCQGERRVIMPGDRIVSVNGCSVPDDILQQCSTNVLLRIQLKRN